MAFYNKTLEETFANKDEIRSFNESLRTSLPTSFRINKSGSNYSFVMKRILEQQEKGTEGLETFLKQYEKLEAKMFDLKQIHWFPRKSVWTMDATRNLLKKCPAMKVLHKQIQKGSDGGLLTRQELVSMLPPLFMDIQPNDKVLDMCAAPGSKTSQLLENLLMGCSESQNEGTSFKNHLKALGSSKGAIIANEIETKRAFILSHQMKRFNSSNVAVINHPGQGIPTLLKGGENKNEKFYFDKVLVDVPCSGDGAIRKIPLKWRNWKSVDGMNLHYLQIQLLEKALDVVKVGGLVVYSTCSLNPVENEAVVAEVFRRANKLCPGSLQLEDVHSRFNGLIMRKGMTKWELLIEKSKKEQQLLRKKSNKLETKEEEENKEQKEIPVLELPKKVFTKEMPDLERYIYVNGLTEEDEFEPVPHENYFNCYDSYDEYMEAYKDLNPSDKVQPSLFYQNQEEMKNIIEIEKTGRIHPHDQNTGGFYLALFRKTKDFELTKAHIETKEKEEEKVKEETIKEEKEEEIKETKEEAIKTPPKKEKDFSKQKNVLKEKDLMNFNPISEEEWEIIKEEFDLSEDFPKHLLVNSSNKHARRVNFINQGLYDMLSVPGNSRLRKIYFGVAVFARNFGKSSKVKSKFRLSYAGIPLIYPYLQQNIIDITFEEFKFFLQRNSSMSFNDLKQCESMWKKIEPIKESSYCLKMDLKTENDWESGTEFLVLQKMPSSIGIMVSREQLDALRTKYGIELIEETKKEQVEEKKN
jgi:16S rRNA C967 or C1407 C5-methylase (RsmB/RsmF family)